MSTRYTRNRNADSASVPKLGDPDRKRMLNVLAQRRYRKRKRDRLAALEAKVNSITDDSHSDSNPLSGALPSPPTSEDLPTNSGSSDQQSLEQLPTVILSPEQLALQEFLPDLVDFSFYLGDQTSNSPFRSAMTDPMTSLDLSYSFITTAPPMSTSLSTTLAATIPSPTSFPLTSDQDVEIPALKLLRAGLHMAHLLSCADSIFDPTASRLLAPINDITIPSWLQPTDAQQKIPHHPFLDILPWPSVRTKLVCIFAQPLELRPPSAKDPLALLSLVSDMEDDAEGIRLEGEDGLVPDNWEIGQAFFRNWWWALDREIVERSNVMRVRRGAARLQLTQ